MHKKKRLTQIVRNRMKKLIMLRGMFQTIVMDKPLVKKQGKFERIENYSTMEIFWNEPLETLNLLYLEEDIKENDKKVKGIAILKSKAGTPEGI